MRRALTPKERRFAEEHHNLIYAFLNAERLPEDLYYDIAAFGYLRAVCKYSDDPRLRHYAFSTIAWRNMRSEISNYLKYRQRTKWLCNTVSLDTTLRNALIGREDDVLAEMEARLLLCDIVKALPSPHAQAVALKATGYNLNEIGKALKRRNTAVKELLSDSYDTVTQMLDEYRRIVTE